MCRIYYAFGVTCAGKDTLMDRAQELYPNLVGLVNVGKEFRKRYPPEYFQGKGAMLHTEREAIEIFETQLAEQRKDKKIIFVSGQPRMVAQIKETIGKYSGTILWLHVSDETLKQRLEKRFVGDPGSYQLSLKRLSNDRIQLFDVVFELIKSGYEFVTFNGDFESLDVVIHNLVHGI